MHGLRLRVVRCHDLRYLVAALREGRAGRVFVCLASASSCLLRV